MLDPGSRACHSIPAPAAALPTTYHHSLCCHCWCPCLPAQATLAAANVAACVQGFPAYNKPDITPFLDAPIASLPQAAPSIVNAGDIGMKTV